MRLSLMPALAVALASLSLLGCGWNTGARFTRVDTLAQPHVASAPLRVVVGNGSIAVEQGDGDEVFITAEIKATTQERLDNTRLVVTRQGDRTLDISVAWPDGKRLSNEGCSVTIAMPDAGTIDLSSSNGRLTVLGVGTDLTLRTSNGRLTASDIEGGVYGRTSNGRITLTNIGGAIDVESSNGRLELDGVAGPVAAKTSNGAVTIRLLPDATGPVQARSSNGAMSLAVGPSFAGELGLSTSNGGVKMDGPIEAQSVNLRKNSGTLMFAGSGASRLSTSNGTITVSTVGE